MGKSTPGFQHSLSDSSWCGTHSQVSIRLLQMNALINSCSTNKKSQNTVGCNKLVDGQLVSDLTVMNILMLSNGNPMSPSAEITLKQIILHPGCA